MSKNNSKQKIIKAAIECLKECPIEKMNMRTIAERAGVTTGSIYHHFKNKDELTLEVMNESLHFSKKLYEDISKQSEMDKPDLIELISSNTKNRLKKTDQQILHVLFFSEIIKRKSSITEKYRQHYKSIINITTKLLEITYNTTHEKAVHISSILVATVDGIAMQQALDVLPDNIDQLSDTFISFFNEYIPLYLKN